MVSNAGLNVAAMAGLPDSVVQRAAVRAHELRCAIQSGKEALGRFMLLGHLSSSELTATEHLQDGDVHLAVRALLLKSVWAHMAKGTWNKKRRSTRFDSTAIFK